MPGIQAWHFKYSADHMLWRPVLGIRRAEPLPGTPRDPRWIPLGKPDTNTRRGLHAGLPGLSLGPRHLRGGLLRDAAALGPQARTPRLRRRRCRYDRLLLHLGRVERTQPDPRDGLPRRHVTRRYAGLWDAILDNSESRIWLGVHWRMDGLSLADAMGNPVHGQPQNPGEVGSVGGVRLGLDIARMVAEKRGF